MKKLPLMFLALSLTCVFATAQKTSTSSGTVASNGSVSKKARKPIFRATADQIKQAQAILKQRNLYTGDQTGKLDTPTRTGLKKYQEAEGLKVTGTLNKVTLEKMSIELTANQKSM